MKTRSRSNISDSHSGAIAGANLQRRRFLKNGVTAAAGAALLRTFAPVSAALPNGPGVATAKKGPIPKKSFGHSGIQLSLFGIGGYHLGTLPSQDEADPLVHEAIDAGINFFDNAWEYHKGKSEEMLGRALEGRRDKVFLMTKVCTHGRDKKVGLRQLEESLKRLRTDHLDLWQIHEVIYDTDPDLHFAPDGVVEALTQAKKEGKVRFVGFTGHKHPAIHLKMLEHDYPFDAVQMPLNCFDGTYRSFEQQVLPVAQRRGMAVLGMKSLGGDGQPLLHGAVTVEEALRYAMSLPVATTITGVDSLSVLHQNLALAQTFQPMTSAEMQVLRDRCASFAADGHLELYKSTKKYDADVGREQHGYPSQEQLPV